MHSRLLHAFILLCASMAASAQYNFNGFNYQAVVRNTAGDPLPNQVVGVKFHIYPGLSVGYRETHSVSTDGHGLLTVVMGEGTPAMDTNIPSFADIPWNNGSLWSYDVSVDITGGTNYQPIAGGHFQAVPFAMHSLTSGSGSAQGWALSGNDLHTTNSGDVGIGTTTPKFDLHVSDGSPSNLTVNWSFGKGMLITDVNQPRIYFEKANAPAGSRVMDIRRGDNGIAISALNDAATAYTRADILVANNNGNVGINTASPAYPLTINAPGYGHVHTSGDVKFGSWIGECTGGDGTLGGWLGTESNHPIQFYTNDGCPQMTLMPSGDLGLGTTAPKFDLHVSDGSQSNLTVNASFGKGMLITDVNQPRIYFEKANAAAGSRVMDIRRGDNGIAISALNDAATAYTRQDILVANNDGNVGIGTSTPGTQLQVGSYDGATDRFLTVASQGGNQYRSGIKLRHFNGDYGYTIESDERFGSYGLNIRDHFADPAGTSVFYIQKSTGFVGIGTLTPQSKLAVNGKVTCKEVEVTTTGFPDYVFREGYDLMSLPDVKRYIQEHGRLPKMPSEAEVLANGLSLGSLNVLLVEKVEELTLQLISTDEQLTSLRAELDALRALVNDIRK